MSAQALQGTLDWHRARLGKFTGSRVGDLMVAGRGKDATFGATAMSYIMQVAAERLLATEVVEDDDLFNLYIETTSAATRAMRFGSESEDEARDLYAGQLGVEVTEAGSVAHPDLPFFAASPDGLVDGGGCLEIKTVLGGKFAAYATAATAEDIKKAASGYYWQMMAEMACTGADWCDLAVYNPFARPSLVVHRVERDEDAVAAMLGRVRLAEAEVQRVIQSIVTPDTVGVVNGLNTVNS